LPIAVDMEVKVGIAAEDYSNVARARHLDPIDEKMNEILMILDQNKVDDLP